MVARAHGIDLAGLRSLDLPERHGGRAFRLHPILGQSARRVNFFVSSISLRILSKLSRISLSTSISKTLIKTNLQ